MGANELMVADGKVMGQCSMGDVLNRRDGPRYNFGDVSQTESVTDGGVARQGQ